MRPRITVTIPVGPKPHHCTHLAEALKSVARQTYPSSVVLVDDMHGGLWNPFYGDPREGLCGHLAEFVGEWRQFTRDFLEVWSPPWRLGVPAAFNAGVALAGGDFVVMLGADDWLEPDALEATAAMIEQLGDDAERAYLYYGVRYSDTGEEQQAPCNAACVPKALWRATGGFAPETAVGACDTMMVTLLMHRPELGGLHYVDPTRPLYNYRRSATTDTATRSVGWQGPIFAVRDMLAREWTPPDWGRFE
jgi:glycosyltransferase involved in cell wall biosynthesis